MSNNNYTLGLDIGIASVGFGIVDDDFNIIETGVRLFDSGDSSKNVDRRNYRQGRRIKRRKTHRVLRVEQFLELYGIKSNNTNLENILSLKIKGLNEKLEIEELYAILTNYVRSRGISYLDDQLADEKSSSSYKKSLSENTKKLEKMLPCEIQMDRLNKFNKYRDDITRDDITYSNTFTTSSYRKEIETILNTNSKFYDFIDDEFISEYLKIFESKRKYYIGPGNEKNRTDYGIYRTDGSKLTNLFSILIGHCSVYNGDFGKPEFRASKASYSAQYFNFLTDMNNLKVSGRSITPVEKNIIKERIIDSDKNSDLEVLKIICSVCNINKEDVKGYRIDKNEKPIFHKFEYFKKFKKGLENFGYSISDFTMDQLDEIADALTINTEKESIYEKFYSLGYNEEIINFFVDYRINHSNDFSGWHSLSSRFMNEIMYDLENTSMNQMQLMQTDNYKHLQFDKMEKYKGLSEIPIEDITNEIYNPVVSKSISETIKIVNLLVKKYGDFKGIIIEMPRESNDKERIDNINNIQKYNKNLKEEIEKKLREEYSIVITNTERYNHKKLDLKLKLWFQQDAKCLYSGKTIYPKDIIENPNMFEIDHIIPISISFDDSQNNKVLVYGTENRDKSNMTAYKYLELKHGNWNIETYKLYVKGLLNKKIISKTKFKNLIDDRDITDKEVLKGFINRNLNDTRYSSRVVLNSLTDYINANDINTKVKVVNGSFTSQFRRKLKLRKDRDTSHAHHGIDALICAYSNVGFNKYTIWKKAVIDFETGEILDMDKYNSMNKEEQYNEIMFAYNKFDVEQRLLQAEKNMKYSYKIDKKANRGLSKETIFSARKYDDDFYVTETIKLYENLKKSDIDKFVKKFDNEENFFMYKNDFKTWEKIKTILKNYPAEFIDDDGKVVYKNPFLQYKEEFGYITKYSKKDNGPIVSSLKYKGSRLGNCIDISHKYNLNDNKRISLLSVNPYRTDIYINKNAKNEKDTYRILRLNYVDFKYTKNNYILKEDIYEMKLKQGGITDDYEFMFSLYKNEIIQFEYEGEIIKCRACGAVENAHRIEIKPIDKKAYTKEDKDQPKRMFVTFSKVKNLMKINTDRLGNEYITVKEKFKKNIDLF